MSTFIKGVRNALTHFRMLADLKEVKKIVPDGFVSKITDSFCEFLLQHFSDLLERIVDGAVIINIPLRFDKCGLAFKF